MRWRSLNLATSVAPWSPRCTRTVVTLVAVAAILAMPVIAVGSPQAPAAAAAAPQDANAAPAGDSGTTPRLTGPRPQQDRFTAADETPGSRDVTVSFSENFISDRLPFDVEFLGDRTGAPTYVFPPTVRPADVPLNVLDLPANLTAFRGWASAHGGVIANYQELRFVVRGRTDAIVHLDEIRITVVDRREPRCGWVNLWGGVGATVPPRVLVANLDTLGLQAGSHHEPGARDEPLDDVGRGRRRCGGCGVGISHGGAAASVGRACGCGRCGRTRCGRGHELRGA